MDSCEYCDTQIDYHEVIECITCALDAKIHIRLDIQSESVIWRRKYVN